MIVVDDLYRFLREQLPVLTDDITLSRRVCINDLSVDSPYTFLLPFRVH